MGPRIQGWGKHKRNAIALAGAAFAFALFYPILASGAPPDRGARIAMMAISLLLVAAWGIVLAYFLRLRRRSRLHEPLLVILAGLLALDALREVISCFIVAISHATRAGLPWLGRLWILGDASHAPLLDLLNLGVVAVVLWAIRNGLFREVSQLKERDQEVTRQNEYLSGLHAIAQATGASLQRDEIIDGALKKILELMGMGGICLYLMNPARDALELVSLAADTPVFLEPRSRVPRGGGLTWQCAEDEAPIFSECLRENPEMTALSPGDVRVAAFACIPLLSRGKCMGVLVLGDEKPRDFSPLDIQSLTDIGQQLGMAIENADLLAKEQARRQEVESLLTISSTFGATLDYEETVRAVVDETQKLLDVDFASLRIFDESRENLIRVGAQGIPKMMDASLPTWPASFLKDRRLAEALRRGEPVTLDGAHLLPGAEEAHMGEAIRSVLVVPLIFRGEEIGFLFAATMRAPRRFSPHDCELATALARHAAMTIQNAHLYKLAREHAENLEEAKRFTEGLIDGMLDVVIAGDGKGRCTYINHYGAELLGYAPEELLGVDLQGLVANKADIQKAIGGSVEGRIQDCEVALVDRNGGEIPFSWNILLQHDSAGELIRALCVGRDVREHKRLREEILRRNRELSVLNSIVETINQSLNLDQILQATLERLMAFLEMDATSVVLIDEQTGEPTVRACLGIRSDAFTVGKRLTLQDLPPGDPGQVDGPLIEHEDSQTPILKLLMEKEGLRSFLGVPLRAEGQILGMLNMATRAHRDFSPEDLELLKRVANQLATAVINSRLYQAEQRRAQSQAVLLREAHHRIRNNLQTVAGLLNLELQKGSRGFDGALLRKSLHRIKSVALVHELLLQEDVETVDMRVFARKLADSICQTGTTREKSIDIQVTGDPIVLPSATATSVALAINELVDNSIEHGLRDRNQGTIKIEMEGRDGQARVRVTDDGIGLPPDFDLTRNANIGLRVVKGLIVEHMGGVFTLTRDGVTEATIEFPRGDAARPRGDGGNEEELEYSYRGR